MPSKHRSFTLPEALMRWLERRAEREGLTVSAYVRDILIDYRRKNQSEDF